MNNMNTMFDQESTDKASKKMLTGTAQLTSVASMLANDMISGIGNELDSYEQAFSDSKTNPAVMDELIANFVTFQEDDERLQFIKELGDDEQNKMLKSQQSKRSRAKSKVMTLDNYKDMATAAIAETMIRLATGKIKTSTGPRQSKYEVYTDEIVELLASDQVALRKEIRNVQSKKCILKHSDNFDPETDAYKKILADEALLKSVRVGQAKVVVVDETKDKLVEKFADVDIENMSKSDTKRLLAELKQMVDNDKEADDAK